MTNVKEAILRSRFDRIGERWLDTSILSIGQQAIFDLSESPSRLA
jgi:hypothetical protein